MIKILNLLLAFSRGTLYNKGSILLPRGRFCLVIVEFAHMCVNATAFYINGQSVDPFGGEWNEGGFFEDQKRNRALGR